MYPRITFYPRSAFELVALAVAFTSSIGCAILWRKQRGAAMLFLAYFGGALALAVGAHAAWGRSAVEISTYAVALVLGAFVAWSILLRRLPEAGVPPAAIYAIIVGCLVFGVVGARIADVALSGTHVTAGEGRLAGLGVFGALALDAVYVAVLLRVAFPRVSFLLTLDAGASSVLVNIGIARIGCLLAGCCFGAPARGILTIPLDWFDPSSPVACSTPPSASRIWATQPVEAAIALGIAAACAFAWKHRSRLNLRPGAVVSFAAIALGSARFAIEFCRRDSPRVCLGLTVWQFCAAALVFIVTVARVRRWSAAA